MGEKKSGKEASGLFGLFDLKKSRKKLLSNRSALSKSTSKDPFTDKASSSEQCEEEEAVGFISSTASADVGNFSLKTDGDNAIRALGIVARLMGLDSLPVAAEMKVTQYNNPHSFQGSRIIKNRNLNLHTNDQFNHEVGRDDGNSKKALNMPDVGSGPIDSFCMEVLPSQLVKGPMAPHDNVLLPMKTPVVIPQNSLLLMRQEASKLLDHPYQANKILNAKPFRPSAIASKHKYSKETLIIRAPARPKTLPVRSMDSDLEMSLRLQLFDGDLNVLEVGNCDGKVHGKETYLPDKKVTANVRVNDQLHSTNRSKLVKKDTKQHRSLNCQNSRQPKARAENAPDVTRKYNLKMKEGDSCSILTSNLISHGINLSPEYQNGNKLPCSISLRKGKCNSVSTDKRVDDLAQGDRCLPHKKGFIRNNIINSVKKSAVGESQMDSRAKCVRNFVIDEHSRWRNNNVKNFTDVVSFTFATPIVKPVLGHDIPSVVMDGRGKVKEKSLGICNEEKVVCFTTTKQLSTEFKNISGDALGILLEEKLKELAARINPPNSSSSKSGSELQVVPHDLASDNHIFSTSGELKGFNCESCMNDEVTRFQFECSLADAKVSCLKTMVQKDIDYTEISSCSSGSQLDIQKEPDHPSPLSILEASFSPYESYESPIGLGSTNASKIGALDTPDIAFTTTSQLDEAMHLEFSDFVCSVPPESANITAVHDEKSSQEWKYVREILSAALVSNRTDVCHLAHSWNNLNPLLFNELECKGSWCLDHEDDGSGCRLGRKVLFDCVGEFLCLKIILFFKAGYRAWSKGMAIFGKCLAERACKEILAWRNMEGLVVEELMDWDMSNRQGRWDDFEMEAFELGEEIERGLLSSLVEEIINGFLLDCPLPH